MPGFTKPFAVQIPSPEKMDGKAVRMDGGIDASSPPSEISPNATPDCLDVRFEQGGVRRDFGWTAQGSALASAALGIAEYEFIHPTTGVKTRKPIVVRRSGGLAAIQRWTGAAWDGATASTRTMADKPIHIEVIQGAAVWADGNFLHMYRETGGPLHTMDDFPTGNALTAAGNTTELTLTGPAITGQYLVYLRATVQSTGSVFFIIEPYVSGAYALPGIAQQDVVINEGTVPLIEDRLYEFNFPGTQPTKFRIRLLAIGTATGQATPVVELHGWNSATDGDPRGGVTYIRFSASGTTFDVVSAEAPLGPSYAFGFEDRLVALGRTGDPQAISWSKGGNIEKWNDPNDGSGSISAVDTVVDPLDEIVAGAKVGESLAAIFRKRSILSMTPTGILTLALGVKDWISGVGTESPCSVVVVPGGVMFIADNLMPMLLTPSGHTAVGEPIHALLLEAGITQPDKIVAAYDHLFETYMVGVPEAGASTFSKIWMFDYGRYRRTGEKIWRPRAASGTSMAVLTEF